jgi:tape measure domain-containing protein
MAGNDRVGALYYEVILDPRGFARGASVVKNEQNVLVRAVQKTVSEQDKIKAELIAIQKQMTNATGEELALLRRYKGELINTYREISRKRREAAREAAREAREQAERQRYSIRNILSNVAAQNTLRDKLGQVRKTWDVQKKAIMGVNGGLSKMAGNLAQGLGFGPQVQGMARAFGALGLKVAFVATATLALAAAAWKGVWAYDAWLQKINQLTTMMGGNAKAARGLSAQMEQFANITSFTTEQLNDFAVQMMNLGVRRKDIAGLAKTLGTLSFGDPQKLKLIGKAYSDVMAKGKLMAQEANQLANANVPVWQALSKMLKKDVSTIREMAEAGEITADQLKQALEAQAASIGGVKLLTQRLSTASGQWEMMKNSMGRMIRDIGEMFYPLLIAVLTVVNSILYAIEKVIRWIKIGANIVSLNWKRGLEQVNEELGNTEDLAYDMKEALEDTYRIIAEQNIQAKEQVKTYEELLDAVQNRFRSEEEMAERAYKAKMDQLVIEEEITQEQADRLIIAERAARQQEREREDALANLEAIRERNEAEKKEREAVENYLENEYEKYQEARASEFEGKVEEARKLRDQATSVVVKQYRDEMKQIDESLKDRLSAIDEASAGGQSFQAGSTEEAQFLREMDMQARRDQMQEKFEVEAAKQRQAATDNLNAMRADLAVLAQGQVSDLESEYGLTAP